LHIAEFQHPAINRMIKGGFPGYGRWETVVRRDEIGRRRRRGGTN
jgi:hypothetical protein